MRLFFILACAPLGWLLATPLLAWGRYLLARVQPEGAAPVALAMTTGTTPSRRTGAACRAPTEICTSAPCRAPTEIAPADTLSPLLPLSITTPWRWALRLGLAVLLPLAVWRAATMAGGHLGAPLVALGLIGCVATLALVAVLDGTAHLIFPPVVALPAIICGLLGLGAGAAIGAQLMGAAAAGGAVLALYLAGRLLYGTDALGFGDVQLAATCGVMLGAVGAIRALVWGLLLLALTLVILLAMRRITLRTYVPLGTFIVLGAVLALLTQPLPWR
jgi:prepilin signal peptidase PulO-like enzyme (type II secretory pathway)